MSHLQLLEVDSSQQKQNQEFLQFFIVARLKSLPEIFVLGDEKNYNGYYNRALDVQQQYRCFVLAHLEDLESVSKQCN